MVKLIAAKGFKMPNLVTLDPTTAAKLLIELSEKNSTCQKNPSFGQIRIGSSVAKLGDLLDFGQLLKAFGRNLFAQISHILRYFL